MVRLHDFVRMSMSDRSKKLARTRDEPMFAVLGLILAAERLIDAKAAPQVHQNCVTLIEAVRAELAKASAHPRG